MRSVADDDVVNNADAFCKTSPIGRVKVTSPELLAALKVPLVTLLTNNAPPVGTVVGPAKVRPVESYIPIVKGIATVASPVIITEKKLKLNAFDKNIVAIVKLVPFVIAVGLPLFAV